MKRAVLLVLMTLLTACSDEKAAEKAAKEGFTKDYNDPATIQYRNVIIYSPETGVYAICGELNGKNKFGAYTGFKKFVALADIVDGKAQYRDNGSTDEYPTIYKMLDGLYCHNGK